VISDPTGLDPDGTFQINMNRGSYLIITNQIGYPKLAVYVELSTAFPRSTNNFPNFTSHPRKGPR
jgi:hypothetical protein